MKIYEVRQYRTISHMVCTYVAITTISDSTLAKIVIICVAIFANLKHSPQDKLGTSWVAIAMN